MRFESRDRNTWSDRLRNQGTVATDGTGWSGNPWGEIGGFNNGLPPSGFTSPLVTIVPPLTSHQEAGGAAPTAGSTNTSSAALNSGSVEAVPGTQTQVGGKPAFDIIIAYDTSWSTLQANDQTLYNAVTNAITQAVSFYEAQITNSATVSVVFGWGYEDNVPVSGISQSSPGTGNSAYAYTTLRDALVTHDPALAADLPATDPQPGAEWDVYLAQAYALGLVQESRFQPPPTIGHVGLSSSTNFTFGQSAVAGAYDAIGALEHEISEVLGRSDILGTLNQNGTLLYSVMDLLRFSGPGTHDYTAGPGSYISLDNGTTDLGSLPDSTSKSAGYPDAGDWLALPADSYDANANSGTANTVSAADLSLLNALGYSLAPACYVAGTHIFTVHGDVRVEDLTIGERVLTRFAGLTTVKWIGARHINFRRHPNPQEVWPVRIAACAFAPGQPRRDLFLSPDHAVAVGDMLIPIRQLVNGASIRQETGLPHVQYFHVELDRHDLLFAEGLEAESYLDTGNRGMFENAEAPFILHPRFQQTAAQADRLALSCLPLHCEPAQVRPVWDTLAARAEALGFTLPALATTEHPALHLAAGERRFDPITRVGGRYIFALPELTDEIRLRSRAASPAIARPWLDDRRQLGVMVRHMAWRNADGAYDIPLDDPRLTDGWWTVERDGTAMCRWTDGDALLPRLDGPTIIEVLIGDTLPYPLAAPLPVATRAA